MVSDIPAEEGKIVYLFYSVRKERREKLRHAPRAYVAGLNIETRWEGINR